MDHHFVAILEAAGVEGVVSSQKVDASGGRKADEAGDAAASARVRYGMERWLGLHDDDDDDDEDNQGATATTTVEDCLPLSPHVYSLASKWLMEAWTTTTTTIALQNGLEPKQWETIETNNDALSQHSFERPILDTWFPSVQATRYLCLWMEFNLQQKVDAEEDDDAVFLVRQLLQANNNSNSTALIRALYQHVQSLPLLLQHVHSMTRRCFQSVTTNNTTDAPSRLQRQSVVATQEQQQHFRTRCQQEWDDHTERLTAVLHVLYQAATVPQRRLTRRLLGHAWQSVVYYSSSTGNSSSNNNARENTQAVAVRPTLRLLRSILRGSGGNSAVVVVVVVSDAHRELLLTTLVALHTPNGVVLWRDQAPVLELYHEVLCQCIGLLLAQQPSLTEPFLTQVAKMMMHGKGNQQQQQHSGKQVLLLHEMEAFLPFLPPSAAETFVPNVMVPLLAQCIQSDHFRVAEQALQFFRRDGDTDTKQKINGNLLLSPVVLQNEILWKSLVRRTPSWNPTVRKMTAHVLELFEESDPDLFRDTCHRFFSPSTILPQPQSQPRTVGPPKQPPEPDMCMAASNGRRPITALPPAKTKVAPLTALPRSVTPQLSPSLSSMPQARWSRGSGQPPPLTVTGVAPWAQQQHPLKHAPMPPQRGVAPWANNHKQQHSAATNAALPSQDSKNDDALTGYEFVMQHIRQLKPKPTVASCAGANIMSETPTFLPTLQFHDLVFGHELGRGSFGTVQYAKHIHKQQPLRSLWPEYAVKIVPQHAHRSFREIATLSLISHPGVARLVSYFAFRANGVYMVLEYASGGDLQTLLQQQGSLSVDATRSVMGQVLAALDCIHDESFVYGDLKPENIVVTASHHVKLTDFGACRGASAEAKERVDTLARELQATIRDGDWKITGKRTLTKNGFVPLDDAATEERGPTGEAVLPDGNAEDEETLDLEKIEGTTAYLPPEVVMGDIPTKEADCWAFGCVLYQCLSGRPPLLEADEAATKNRIVQFDSSSVATDEDAAPQSSSTSAELFTGDHAKPVTNDGRSLILALLDRDRTKRPGMKQVASHTFFSTVNVFALYKEPAAPLGSGSVGPAPQNAKWARRQFSSIWAPQPKAYNLDATSSSSSNRRGYIRGNGDDTAIEEGEERDGYYTAATSSTSSEGRRSRSGNMLPPPHRVIVEE